MHAGGGGGGGGAAGGGAAEAKEEKKEEPEEEEEDEVRQPLTLLLQRMASLRKLSTVFCLPSLAWTGLQSSVMCVCGWVWWRWHCMGPRREALKGCGSMSGKNRVICGQ